MKGPFGLRGTPHWGVGLPGSARVWRFWTNHLVPPGTLRASRQQTSHSSRLHEGLPSTCVCPRGLRGGGRRAPVVPARPQRPEFPVGVVRLMRGRPRARWTDTGSCPRPLEGSVEIPNSWSMGGDPESASGFPRDPQPMAGRPCPAWSQARLLTPHPSGVWQNAEVGKSLCCFQHSPTSPSDSIHEAATHSRPSFGPGVES